MSVDSEGCFCQAESREPEAFQARRHRLILHVSIIMRLHVNDSSSGARGPESGHRVLGRARHECRAALDAGERRHPVRLHRQPRATRRTRLRRDPAQGARLRRREGPAHRLPGAARERRHRGAAVRGLPHLHRRRSLLQHHPDRARGHRHDAGARHERRRRPHLGRRQHLQGQRHRTVLPLRPARQSGAAHLQALARSGVHRRAGRPEGDVGIHGTGRAQLQDEHREGLFHRLEHPRRHARSQGSRAAEHRHHDRRADHGRGVVARGCRGEARRGVDAVRRGRPGRAQRAHVRRRRRADARGQPHRRPPRARHERSDREPHHRGQEPRHLRRRPAWRCSSSATSA